MSSNVSIHIDPLVGMCCLDHYTRRPDSKETSVVGALLGTWADGVIEVRCTISAPINDKKKAISSMVELHHKVYPKDKTVGWYMVGKMNSNVTRRLLADTNVSRACVFLQMDPTLASGSLNSKIFMLSSMKYGEQEVPQLLKEVPFKWKSRYHVSKVALQTMIGIRHNELQPLCEGLPTGQQLLTQDLHSCPKQQTRPGLVTPQMRSGDRIPFDQVHRHLLQIQAALKRSYDYVTAVVEGKEKEDPVIGRSLFSLIQSVPPVEPEAFDKLFNSTTQDMLMINYLAKLIQTQVYLMERLHVYIPDTKVSRPAAPGQEQ